MTPMNWMSKVASAALVVAGSLTLSVLGGTAPQAMAADGLAWGVPELSAPTVISITQANRDLKLPVNQDYVLDMPDVELTGINGLRVDGGRNVVLLGGAISIDDVPAGTSGDARRGLVLKNQTGVVHIEGLHIGGNALAEGIQIASPNAIVQLQNIRVDRVASEDPSFHSDVVQVWGGVRELRVDRLTGSSAFQGIFLKSDVAGAPIGAVDLRRVNITGGSGYLFYADPAVGSVSVSDVFAVPGPSKKWQYSMFPQAPAADWAGVVLGAPIDGDYVPNGAAGGNAWGHAPLSAEAAAQSAGKAAQAYARAERRPAFG